MEDKKNPKIVVIGGVAVGPKAAARARRLLPEAEITIIERGRLLSYSGCGMPYYIEGVVKEVDSLLCSPGGCCRATPTFFRKVKDVEVLNGTLATHINRDKKNS